MATNKWVTPANTVSYLSTELANLESGALMTGAEITNNTDLYKFMSIEIGLTVQDGIRHRSTPKPNDIGAHVAVYAITDIGSGTYSYGGNTATPSSSSLLGRIEVDDSSSNTIANITRIPIPPHKLKLIIKNNTGQKFSATGNTLKYTLYNDGSV